MAVVTFMTDYVPKIDKAMWERIGPFVRDAVSVACLETAASADQLGRSSIQPENEAAAASFLNEEAAELAFHELIHGFS